MGNEYMAYMRSLPKRKKAQEESEFAPNELQMLDQKLNEIVKVKKERNPLYEKSRKKNLQIKVS